MSRFRAASSGMTLIELVVAVSIASLLLTGLFGAYVSLEKSRRENRERQYAEMQAWGIQLQIARDLQSLAVHNSSGDFRATKALRFLGKNANGIASEHYSTADRTLVLSFASRNSELWPATESLCSRCSQIEGVQKIRYELTGPDLNQNCRLIRTECPYAFLSDAGHGTETLYSKKIRSFSLSFFDASGIEWESWDSLCAKEKCTALLPQCLRLSFSLGLSNEKVLEFSYLVELPNYDVAEMVRE